MTTDNVYESLEPFENFEEVTDDRHYVELPGDWIVFVTDIKNSTEAIEAGNYRDVNKVGAASITVVIEALGEMEFPFVFGGDGATLVVSPDVHDTVTERLLGLKKLVRNRFDLELRVGSMKVDELVRENVSLEVAKLSLTPGRDIAISRGGGLSKADQLIKNQRERFEISGESVPDIEMTGLSCRWEPIPSKRGNILSVLIRARSSAPEETYNRVIRELDLILEGGLTEANPINTSRMDYRSVWKNLVDEVRYHSSIFSVSFLVRVLEIIFAVAVFKFGFPSIFFDADEYRLDLRTHSDYRKFDDMLRFIIDCDSEEKRRIRNFLKDLHREGQIFYGVQEADESLMTCYVEELSQGGHLHFIDGGEGGYARAAGQLKKQIREATES